MEQCAPVALFVYNRPEHTRKTVEALQANQLAGCTDLFIYSDAARDQDDIGAVNQVRAYIRSITGFARIVILEHASNKGLASSITCGVGEVIGKYGRVIVLEDDLVTSPAFLTFMNQALDYYAEDDRVMSINGYIPPGIRSGGNEPFFIRCPSSWGWATWGRSWKYFQDDPAVFVRRFSALERHQFDFDSTFPFYRTIVRNYRGKMRTWAIFWYASIFFRHGLCVSSPQSLVMNIGNDGSGTHAKAGKRFDQKVASNEFNAVFPSGLAGKNEIVERKEIVEQYKQFYRQSHDGFMSRIYMYLLPFVRRLQHFFSISGCKGV